MVFDIMLCKYKSFLFLVCLLLLPGCGSSLKEFVSSSSTGNAFQAGPPDEFLSVTKKPLVMPPDYLLRPPSEVNQAFLNDPRNDAKEIILGDEIYSKMTQAEKNILLMANSEEANPNIKKELYMEEGAFEDENLTEYLLRLKDENKQMLNQDEEFERLKEYNPAKNNEFTIKDEENNSIKVEVISMNQYMLQNLEDSTDNIGKRKLNHNLSIHDILDLDKKEQLETINVENGNQSYEKVKDKEIPPVDRMPTVFKGLLGGLSGGFGLF
tara:strand:+ start:5644 stop:6447 length:804 start_codon:yes stop_codon:yes gene_type:complete